MPPDDSEGNPMRPCKSLHALTFVHALVLSLIIGVIVIGWHRQAVAADTPAPAATTAPATPPAADDEKDDDDKDADATPAKPLTPEEKMNARFPQPIRVGDLIGQPLLDGGHATIGYVREVVRTPEGKIRLIVPYRPWWGWATFLGGYGERPVAVPLEAVGSMGPALSSIDMPRDSFDAAPTWVKSAEMDIPPAETIRIGLARE